MGQAFLAIVIIIFTFGLFMAMSRLYKWFPSSLLTPVLTTSVLIILILIIFQIPYETYLIGGKWINELLGPAVVALSFPLYKQRKLLVKHVIPILTGVISGLITGLISIILLALLFQMDHELILSLLPKSLTTPVAMAVSSELGGIPAITVVFVMIAGFSGAILGPALLSWLKIKSDMGKGIAFGSASHAIGTSKAFEYSELSFSMSSVAMALSAIFGAVFASLMPFFL